MSELASGSDLIPSARQDGQSLVVSLKGDIDLGNSPRLRQAIIDLLGRSGAAKLVLNLRQVGYMDSSAVAVLVEMLRKLGRGNVALASPQPRVKGLLEIARLDQVFRIVESESDAL